MRALTYSAAVSLASRSTSRSLNAATIPYKVPDSHAFSNCASRASSSTRSAECSGIGTTTPARDARIAWRCSRARALRALIASGSSGAFFAGIVKFGVRWNTVTCAACSAMTGIDWIPDKPPPMTPTRRPLNATPSCGHRHVVKQTAGEALKSVELGLLRPGEGTCRHDAELRRHPVAAVGHDVPAL